jgi:hypothetical protein
MKSDKLLKEIVCIMINKEKNSRWKIKKAIFI